MGNFGTEGQPVHAIRQSSSSARTTSTRKQKAVEKYSEKTWSLPCELVKNISPGKGAGMVATEHIPLGTVVTKDYPIILVTADEIEVSDVCSHDNDLSAKYDKRHAIVKRKFEQLPPYDQATVLALADTQ